MTNQVLENKKTKIISDYVSFDENNFVSDWQKKQLDETEKRVKKEYLENWFINTIKVNVAHKNSIKFIDKLFENDKI